MEALGIIAGNGEFPVLAARAAREGGARRIVAVAFEGETDHAIEQHADAVTWIKIGQLNKLIRAFTAADIHQAVMAGGITPSNLFKNLRLDLRMVALTARLKERNAHTIFGGIAEELEKDGVHLVDPRPFLGDAVPSEGPLTGKKPTGQQAEDIRFGLRIARTVSDLDIGQTVVVKKGTVLAVEGFEGTDRCLRRGGELAGEDGGAVAVKISKTGHDFRFDIPCVGPETITSCGDRVAVLAMEAGRSMLLGRETVRAAAERAGLCLVGVSAP